MKELQFDIQRFDIYGTNGNDSIYNIADNIYINSDSGNDSISNFGDYVTIYGSYGNDSIFNFGSNVSIDGGYGDDSIYNTSNNVTIDGGNGNDTITNYNSFVSIKGHDGYDVIDNFGDNVTIDAGYNNDSIYNDSGDNSSINLGYGNDSIFSRDGDNLTLDGGYGEDRITGNYWGSKIYGGPDNDYIYIAGGSNNTIYGEDGNDTIIANGGVIYGGNNNDFISLASGGTIDAGYGDDTIYGNSYAILYKYYGRGYDVIYNWSSNDTLSISDTTINYTPYITETSFATSISGSDFIISVYLGAITLSGAVGKTININGTTYLTNNNSGTLLNGTSNGDVVLNNGSRTTINANAGNDSITNTADSVSINGGDGADSIYSSNNTSLTINGGAGDDTIVGKYWNSQIYGGAGADKISLNGDVDTTTINAGTGNDTIYMDNYDGYNYIQYASGDGNDVIYYLQNQDIISLGGGIYTRETLNGNVIVNVIGSGTMTLFGASDKTINIVGGTLSLPVAFTNGADYYSNSKASTVLNALSGNDTVINSASNVTINGESGSDSISNSGQSAVINGGADNDTVINSASYVTIIGGSSNDSVSLSSSAYNNVIKYSSGDGYDTVYGYDSNDTISLGGGYYTRSTVGNNVVVSLVSGGAITLSGANGKTINIVGGTLSLPAAFTNGADYYSNSKASTVLNALSGNDTVINSASNVTINGESGSDSISNSGQSAVINGGADGDKIYNSASYVTITGGTGNDYISLSSNAYNNVIKYSTVMDGNDTVSGYDSNDTISLSGGYYTRETLGTDVRVSLVSGGAMTLSGASGKTINIVGGTLSVPAIFTNGADYYSNSKASTVLNALSGNDTVINSATNVTINGDGGADSISNSGQNVVINGGADNDKINNSGSSSAIYGGNGNDSVLSNGNYTKIYGGTGEDTIRFNGDVDYNTVVGGTGNDTIYMDNYDGRNYIQYANGDGNDAIYYLQSADTISLGGGYYTRETVGNNVIVSVIGSGSMTLYNASSKTINIVGGTLSVPAIFTNGADYYSNSKASTVLNALSGNDTVINSATNVTINGDGGADSISNTAQSVVINGGADGDKIYNSASYVTMTGETGNDYISLSSNAYNNVIKYSTGDGNDTIYGLKTSDTLHITSGRISKSVASGEDVILTVGNGTITLKDVAGSTTYVKIGDNTASRVTLPSDTPPLPTITQQDVIRKFANALDTIKGELGKSAVSQAINIASGGYFKNEQELINSMVESRKKYATGNSGSIEYLKKEFDMDFYDADTGAILGKNAGGLQILDAEDIIPEYGNLDTNFTDNSFTVDGIKFTLAIWTDFDHNQYKLLSYDDLNTKDQQYLWQAMQTWWVKEGLTVIEDSYGYSFEDKNSTVKENLIMFVNDPNDKSTWGTGFQTNWLQCTSFLDGWKNIYKTAITFNMSYYYNFDSSSDKNGISPEGQIYFDRCLTHEMTHAIMSSNVDYYCNLPAYIMEGFCEVVHGGDFRAYSSMIPLANNLDMLQKTYNNSIGYVTNDSLVAEEFRNKRIYSPDYGAGIMLLRYLAKQGSEHYGQINMSSGAEVTSGGTNSGITLSGTTLTVDDEFPENQIYLSDYSSKIIKVDATQFKDDIMIVGNSKSNVLQGGTGNNNIYGNAGNDTLIGGDGDDILHAEAGNNSLVGNAGNDTLYGGSGNDTLYGGSGKDIFAHYLGNIYIMDYNPGQDKIRLTNFYDVITGASIKGNDIILNVNNTSIFVKDGVSKKITVIDGNGNETTQIYPSVTPDPTPTLPSGWKYGNTAKTNLTASVASAANVDLNQTYGTSVATVDGSKITAARTFTGNSKANSIKGGSGADIIYGNAGADILYGGSGNDKIYGGNDNDKIYGDAGNDSLYGNSGNDTLTGGAGNDTFFYENGNDLITDYTARQDKIKFSVAISSSSVSGSNVIFKTSNGNVTVQNGKGKKITVIDSSGKETTQIYPSVTPDPTPTLPSGWKYGNTAKTKLTASVASAANIDLNQTYGTSVATVDGSKITAARTFAGNSKANSIKGGSGADTIYGNAGADILYGGGGNDKIYGGNDNDKIYGDAGNDSLYGNSGNDTLTGGSGNDTFFYENGNDTITDYTAGQDKIKFSVAISSSSVSGSNVIFKTSNGNVTVQNGKGKKITVIDSSGKETTQIYPSVTPDPTPTLPSGWKYGNTAKTKLTASVASAANIDLNQTYGTSVATVDGSKITAARTFTGNSKANSIKGGSGADTIYGNAGADILYGGSGNDKIYGGNDNDKIYGDAGNDSLYGGNGNDTLTGGAGNDVFVYEGGKDVITDYTAGQDKIKNSSGKISKTTYSGKDVIFTIGSGTLTVKNSKGKKITVTDSGNKAQTYSKTLDLIYDNNFVADEFALDDISEVSANNYSVGKLENSENPNNNLVNDSIVSVSYFDEK